MSRQPKVSFVRADVGRFLRLQAQMKDLLGKMTALSAKNPDLVINKFKLSMMNEQLVIANEILGASGKPIREFEVFNDAALPTNSDVVVVLSQYLACMDMWREARIVWNDEDDEWYWDTTDDSELRA